MMLWQKRHPICFFLNASITASIVEGVQTHLKASGYQFRTMHSPLTLSKYKGMKLYVKQSDGGNTTISHCELLLVCRSCIAHRRMIADFFRAGWERPSQDHVCKKCTMRSRYGSFVKLYRAWPSETHVGVGGGVGRATVR